VETVDAGAGFNRLDLTGNDDSVSALDTRKLSTWGLTLSRVDAVDALGGRDLLTLTSGPDTVLVTGVKAATASAVAFTHLESIDAAGGANTARLTGGDDEVRILGERSFLTSELTLTSFQTIDGSAGVDRIELLPKDDVVTLAGPQRLSVDDLALVGFEAIDGGEGANTLQGTPAAESWTIDGVNRGTVQGTMFAQFATVKTGGTATDTFTFTSGGGDITGKIMGEGATVALENTTDALVTLTGPLIAPSVRFGASGAGGFRVANPANEVTTIAAALGGTLVFRNSGTFSIGRVDGLAGLKVGGDLRLEADGGELAIDEPVSTGRHATVRAGRVVQANRIEVGVVDAQGTLDVEAFAGSITFAADAMSRAAGGTIRYAATSDLIAGEIDAGGGSISLLAGGAILDGNDGAMNLRAGAARIQSGIGSIGSAANALETDLGRLSISSGGGLFVDDVSSLVVGPTDAMVTQRLGEDGTRMAMEDAALSPQPTPGDLQITTGAGLSVAGAANGVLEARGSLTLIAGEGDLTLTPALSSGQNMVLLAGRAIHASADVTAATTLDVESTIGSILADPGTSLSASSVRLAAGSDLTLGRVQGIAVSVLAKGNISDGTTGSGAPSIVASAVRLEAGGSIGSGSNAFAVAAETLAAKSGASLYLTEQDGVRITSVPAQTWSRAIAGRETITFTDSQLSGLSVAQDLRLTTGVGKAGALLIEQPVQAGSSVLIASSAGGLTLNAPVTAGSDLSMLSSGDVAQNANLQAGGTLDVTATQGSILMAPSAKSSTNGGDLRYESAQTVALGELNAGKGGILVRAGEAVTDNNGDRLNLVSTRARIEATRGAIGHASRALDLDVPRLEAAAGDSLHLGSTGAIVLGSVGDLTVNRQQADGGGSKVADAGSGEAGLRSTGLATGRVISLTTQKGTVTLAPGAVVSTGTTTARGSLVIGSGTHVEPGATVAGGMSLAAVRIAGEVQSAGLLDLQGVAVQAEAQARARISVSDGTQVRLSGAERASFGSDTLLQAPMTGVERIAANQNVRISAPITGSNLTVTADADARTGPNESGPGGVQIAPTGSLLSTGTLTVTGSAWSEAGANPATLPLAVEVQAGGQLSSTGPLVLASSSQAPAGSSLRVTGLSSPGGATVGSSGGTIQLAAASGGVIELNGAEATRPLLAAAGGITIASPLQLSGPALIESTTSGEIAFLGPVDARAGAAADLVVKTAGLTSFREAVGDRHALTSLSTSALGGTEIGTGRMRVTGALTFGDAVTLVTDTSLTAGSLTFGDSVQSRQDGGAALILSVAGETVFQGAVGDGGRRLKSLATDASGTTRFQGDRVVTLGAQTYADAVLLGGKTDLSASGIVFQNTVDSAPATTGSGVPPLVGRGHVPRTGRAGKACRHPRHRCRRHHHRAGRSRGDGSGLWR
jgi:hypothetical protein